MSRPQPRPDLAGLRAYRTGAPFEGIRLHANENPHPPPPDVMEALAREIARAPLNRYPDPEARELREAIAAYAGVDADRIWVGTGSNEVLFNACLAYGGPGRTALLFEPTYRMHHRQAAAAGTRVEIAWRGPGYAIDVDAAVETIERLRPDIVFVCTPNNPTGTETPVADVRRIAEAARGLVVVDEAYYEFSGVTFAGHLDEVPNAIVVRTLSKAFGLAGVRIGYGIAQPGTLEPLAKVRMPYAISVLAQVAGAVVLRHGDRLLGRVAELASERDRMIRELAQLPGFEVFASAANFVLFRPPDARSLYEGLLERGVLIRDFSDLPGCEGCLRVSAGTEEETSAFLAAVGRLV